MRNTLSNQIDSQSDYPPGVYWDAGAAVYAPFVLTPGDARGTQHLYKDPLACHMFCQQLRRNYGIPEIKLTGRQLHWLTRAPNADEPLETRVAYAATARSAPPS